MGNNFSNKYQNTYKICLKCNELYSHINNDLIVLNILQAEGNNLDIMVRCSKGHIFYYKGIKTHIEYCVEYIDKNNLLENDKLKKENAQLKKQITYLKNINNDPIPSSPISSSYNVDLSITPSAPSFPSVPSAPSAPSAPSVPSVSSAPLLEIDSNDIPIVTATPI